MKALIKKINRILKDRRTRRLLTRIVSVSAALVVFVTTYALVLPAITMEAEAQCGIEAHQHDDSCYEDVLVCGQEESEGHTHDESCYSISQELICEIPEHQHDETCYDEDGNLQCQMQEHEHTADCYKEVRELTCTLEESEGHHHTDACYEKNLICGKEVHTHSPDCYEKEAADAVAASTGYTAGTDSSIVAEEIDHATVENQGTEESAAAATTNVLLPEDLQSEDLSDGYVPQLDSIYFDAVLNNHTAFYYFHPEEGEEVPANSADITSWKLVDKNTELAPTDLVKAYLSYTIPAGSLNETNQIARYRLPANIHLTDDQIIAINNNENGIAAGYVDPSTNTVLDEDAVNYHKYLGAEAVEGTRRPDQDSRNAGEDGFGDTAQEYISATVKAENVFDEEGLYGEKGAYLGQDLIFVFSPYTIEKNQTTYDTAGNPTAKGEKVTGWFAVDLNMEQIDWVEEETREEQIGQVTEEPASEQADQIGEEPVSDQTEQSAEETAPDQIDQSTDEVGQSENTNKTINIIRTTIVKSAEIIFAEENKDVKASEISRRLKLVEYTEREEEADAVTPSSDEVTEADTAAAAEDAVEETVDEGAVEDQVPEDEAGAESTTEEDQATEGVTSDDNDQEAEDKDKETQGPEYKAGSLKSEGDDYKITLDYTAEAKIPADAVLSVREITAETDPEVYQECLDQANAHEATGDSTVDQQTSRFFDIEIVVTDEEGQQKKIEPAAPVSVNIQLPEKKDADQDKAGKGKNSTNKDSKGSDSKDAANAAKSAVSTQDPTVLHFAEKGVEQVEAETSVNETKKDTATEVQFQAESFSIYGVIYTVDFHWEVDGKTYEYSLAGGDSVSFRELLKLLHVIGTADDAQENGEQENGSWLDKITGLFKNNEAQDAGEESNQGQDVGGEELEQFINDISSVRFSDESLVKVAPITEETTAGALKDRLGLECDYSAELSDAQRRAMDSKTFYPTDWALISLKAFTTEEYLTVEMKNGEKFQIRVTDAQIKKTVIDAKGDTWEITVTYGEDAQIPDGAELRVREITEKDTDYAKTRRGIEDGLTDGEVASPVNPVLFDISIWDGEKEIEPKEGSEVKVEVKLVRSALKGLFSDEDTPLLINDAPMQVENGYVEKSLQVIHQAKNGQTEVMDTQNSIVDDTASTTFTTSSFSNWLVFLDEEATNITIGVGDTITLRPYKEWSWKGDQGDFWKTPNTNGHADVEKRNIDDSQLNEQYSIYNLKATSTGTFDIETEGGKKITVNVQDTGITDPPPTVQTIDNTSNGITFNLFDYDRDKGLDEENNKGRWFTGKNGNTTYDKSVNKNHSLKFLGWGSESEHNKSWTHGILDYTKETVQPGIVAKDLVEVTLSDGSKIKVPKLAHSDFNNEDLGYLFDTTATFDNTNGAVQAYPGANGLFQKGGNGYIYYNSNSNYARYLGDKEGGSNTFAVYDHTYQQHTGKNQPGNGKPIGFFPFHDYEPDTDTDGTHGTAMNFNKYLNHHLGMDMAVEFAIPEDGLDEYGNPITFEFSGDDDLWVFLDDRLVLDVGGIHQPVTASINFSNDAVKVYGQSDTSIPAMYNTSEKTWTRGESVPHTMRVYYLERGGCDSNLSIRFNLPTTLGKGKLRVIKNDKKTPATLLSGARFGLYSDERCEHIIEGKDKTSGSDGVLDFGELAFKDVNTTYYLKEISAPSGYMVDTGVYKVKPYVLNGEVQKDSNGYVVLQVIAPDGTALAQTNPGNLALSSIEFPNEKVSTIDIPAEKKWSDDVVTESAQITLTIKRYKLVSQTKGLTIEQNLIGKPNNHTFQADYTITYTTADGGNRTIYLDYTKFSAGRYTITDIEPGTYTVVQNIRSGVPDNYTRTDDPENHQRQVTLPEDGTATAEFTSTYVQKKGTLNLKAVVENMPSGVSYNGVRYAILDSSGKKVTSVTYQQIMNGKDIALPVGTYSIKAVNLPKDPDGYTATRTISKDGETVVNATVNVGNVNITEGGSTSVQFNNIYTLSKATNCKWKIVEQYDNNKVYASGNVADTNNNWFNGGQSVRLTFSLDTNKYYGNLDTISYMGQSLSASDDGTNSNWHSYHVDFNAMKDSELIITVNRNKMTQEYGFVGSTSITTPNSLHMPRTLRAPKGTTLGSAANNTEEIHETNPADAHTVTDPETQEPTNVPANLPAAPAYKKYVKDVLTSGSDWQKTIVLNKDNTPAAWKDTLRDLEACDVDGNPYYYYVAAVDETGLEKVTTVTFGNNGDELLLIGADNLEGNSLNVTNTVKRQGALALTKIVTLNGADNTTDMTKGDYTFTIEGVAGTSTSEETHNVTIHFENGRATSYIVDGTRTDCKGTDNSWTVVLQNLTAGDYVITESQMSNNKMELTSVTGGKGDGNKDTKKVTVTVHPGDETPENDDARAAFTNDRTEKVKITVNKVWSPEPLDSEHPSITLKLHRYAKKTKGTINITLKDTMQSDPDHVSAPIEGAVFTLYEADTPSGPWTATSTTVTTDVNGNASASGLAPGKSYKLVQTSTPQRYSYNVENPPESAVLTVQDNSLQTQEVSTRNLTNEALITSATVTLTLTESNVGSGSTDNKIDGARFKLYKDGTLYRTDDYETRDGGKIVVSGLPAGEYYFVQTAVTADYRMPADPKTAGFTVQDKPWEDQSHLTQSMTNDLKGKGTITVTLKKDNADNGDPIANADFQLRKGDDLIASATTDNDGRLTFTKVYEGDYTVHQVNAGDAASDGYEIDPSDKPVSIAANSVTNQTPDTVVFVNECTIGDVTIRLWTKQQAVDSAEAEQRNTPYNWKLVKEYTGKHVGETYTFTATLNADIYPNFVRYAEDNAEITEFPSGNNDNNYVLYNKGTGNESYEHLLKESDIQSLNSSGYNDGTYSFTLTPTEQNKVYNLVLISSWGNNQIYTFAMNEDQALRAAAPQEPQKALNSRMQAGFGAGKKALSASGRLKNAPAATEAQPHKPSDADYFEDTVNFTPIEHTINKSPWTYQFPAQDKYDPNGEPYYYYVEETSSTPDEYVIESYVGDPVSGTDTGSITITNTRPEYGSLKLTKALTVNGTAPKNSSDWALVAGDYTFTVKNSAQEAVKTITLHVDATGVSLVSPTDDSDVTLSAGVVTIAKLPKGDYTLEEAAPANGTKLSGVTVSASGSVENKVATVTVNDKNQQTEIPLVTFTNNMNTGDLSLTKQVAGEGAEEEKAFRFTIQLTAPDGQMLADSYSFKKGEDTAEGITYKKDANNATRATVTGISLKHNEVFTIEGLPAGTTYLVTEADYSSEGYSSSIPAEGLPGTITDESEAKVSVTATNTLSAGNLTVEKTLEGNATDPAKDFNFSVTFNKDGKNGVGGSYRTGTTDNIASATPHDVTFASGTSTVRFTLKGGEKAEFSGLPVGTTFTVSETSRDADGYETTVSSTGGTVNTGDKTVTGSISARTAVTASYVNKKNKTIAEAAKEWQSGAQTITWPEDVEKVEFTLFKTVNGSTTAVTGIDLTSFATAEQIEAFQNPVEITSSTDGKKAVWNNLPEKYWLDADVNASPAVEAGWYDATYTVKETKIVYTAASGKPEETKDIAAVNNVITNEIEKVQIHAAKQWKDKNGTVLDGKEGKAYPANAQVTFTLVKDGTPDNTHTVVLDGVDETKNPSTGATVTPAKTDYEGADWTAWFTDLPKYTDQGKLINYTVKETAKMEGYETEGSDTVGDEGTITNKEISVDINILKVDKTDGETPLAGAKFVLKRYNEGYHDVAETWPEQEVSSDAGTKGQLKFEKLAIGHYELVETNPPAGYVRTSANPRFKVKIDTDGSLKVEFTNTDMVTYDSTTKTFTVKNEPGAALPNSGGPGTRLFYLLGIALAGFAGAGLLLRKHRSPGRG